MTQITPTDAIIGYADFLADAAQVVIETWEDGDLAAAVTELAEWLETYRAIRLALMPD